MRACSCVASTDAPAQGITHLDVAVNNRGKGEYDTAIKIAKCAVQANPDEYLTWSLLTEIYTASKQYDAAMLALNCCPMYGKREEDKPGLITLPAKWPVPVKLLYPATYRADYEAFGSGTNLSEPLDEADPMLYHLQGALLTNTAASAYRLLTAILAVVGWDQLLAIRHRVFLMRDEYKQTRDSSTPEVNIAGKRLCQLWLDNLFMVLYEDFRMFAIWNAAQENALQMKTPYLRTAFEWELFGDLAFRLGRMVRSVQISYPHASRTAGGEGSL